MEGLEGSKGSGVLPVSEVRLEDLLSPSMVLVGVGNILKGDDAFGPLLIQQLSSRSVPLAMIDAGTAPENQVSRIAQFAPSLVVLVDVVHFGAPPGTVRLFDSSELAVTSLTTHGMPLSIVLEEIESRTSAPSMVLGIQPESLGLGEPLSTPVRKALEEVVETVSLWAVRIPPSPSPPNRDNRSNRPPREE